MDIPTSDPHRDERGGWVGDATLIAPVSCSNMFMAGFYSKWFKDMLAEHAVYGFVPCVVPRRMGLNFPVVGWSDGAVILPWLIYRRYGDTRILEEHYQSMKDLTGLFLQQGMQPGSSSLKRRTTRTITPVPNVDTQNSLIC